MHPTLRYLLVFLALLVSGCPKNSSSMAAPDASSDASAETTSFALTGVPGPRRPLAPSPVPSATQNSGSDAGHVLASFLPPSATGTFVIYQPNGVNGPITYTSMTVLAAQWGTFQGPLTIFCDPSFASDGQTCLMPGSAFTFASKYLTFASFPYTPTFASPTFSFPTGATFSVPVGIVIDNCTLAATGTTSPFSFTSGMLGFTIEMRGVASIYDTGSASLFNYATGSASDYFEVELYDNSSINSAFGTAPGTINISGPGGIFINGFGLDLIFTNSIGAPTAAQVNLTYTPSAQTFNSVQRGILDTQVMPAAAIIALSQNIVYTNALLPGVANVNQALNTLAAEAADAGGILDGDVTGPSNNNHVSRIDGIGIALDAAGVETGTGIVLLADGGLGFGASSGAGGGGWITALDFDFTAQATTIFLTDTTYSFGGFTWKKINSADDATPMENFIGVGLVVKPISSAEYNNGSLTAPILSVSLNQIIPNFDPTIRTRGWVNISSQNAAANFDNSVFGFDTGLISPGVGPNFGAVLERGFGNNGQGITSITLVTGADQAALDDLTVLDGGSGVTFSDFLWGAGIPAIQPYYGAFTTTWPTVPNMLGLHGNAIGNSNSGQWNGTNITPTNLQVVFGAKRSNSGTSGYAVTFARFRIDYKL
jgi:hypothetical protein